MKDIADSLLEVIQELKSQYNTLYKDYTDSLIERDALDFKYVAAKLELEEKDSLIEDYADEINELAKRVEVLSHELVKCRRSVYEGESGGSPYFPTDFNEYEDNLKKYKLLYNPKVDLEDPLFNIKDMEYAAKAFYTKINDTIVYSPEAPF